MNGRFYAYYFSLFIICFYVFGGCTKNDNPENSQETLSEFAAGCIASPSPQQYME